MHLAGQGRHCCRGICRRQCFTLCAPWPTSMLDRGHCEEGTRRASAFVLSIVLIARDCLSYVHVFQSFQERFPFFCIFKGHVTRYELNSFYLAQASNLTT